jgi:hypothetical protein
MNYERAANLQNMPLNLSGLSPGSGFDGCSMEKTTRLPIKSLGMYA